MPKKIDETALFRVVLKELIHKGYQGSTTAEIAEKAGVNEATLFRRYKNKAGLFLRALEIEFKDTALSELTFTGNLEKDLIYLVEAYLDTNRLHGELIPIVITELSRSKELLPFLSILQGNLLTALSIITRYQDQKRLSPDTPAKQILNQLIGPLMSQKMFQRAQGLLDHPRESFDATIYIHQFLHGHAGFEDWESVVKS